MKPKIYIAGKITGDADYKAKFDAAAKFYEEKGYTVLSPSVLPEGMLAADYIRICFAMIDTCDAVAFLPDFRQSAGARLEYDYCLYTDKSVHHYADDTVALLASAETDVVAPLLEPVIKMPGFAEEIKKALEKDLHKGLYPNFMEGAAHNG